MKSVVRGVLVRFYAQSSDDYHTGTTVSVDNHPVCDGETSGTRHSRSPSGNIATGEEVSKC
jgi:hypothetical protein